MEVQARQNTQYRTCMGGTATQQTYNLDKELIETVGVFQGSCRVFTLCSLLHFNLQTLRV